MKCLIPISFYSSMITSVQNFQKCTCMLLCLCIHQHPPLSLHISRIPLDIIRSLPIPLPPNTMCIYMYILLIDKGFHDAEASCLPYDLHFRCVYNLYETSSLFIGKSHPNFFNIVRKKFNLKWGLNSGHGHKE